MLQNVGLNLLYIVPGAVGGAEIYARELVGALARERPSVRYVAFCGQETADRAGEWGWPPNVRVHRLPGLRASVKPLRIAAELTQLPAAAARERVDVLHSLGTTSPLVGPRPRVVTILDLIYEHFPQTFSPAARAGLRALVGPAARRADRVIAISEAVRDDIVTRLGVDPDRVDVIHLGLGMAPSSAAAEEHDLRRRLGLGDARVLLCVSAALEHKNLPRLIEVLATLESDDAVLVIVGHAGRESEQLRATAEQMGVADRVVLTGWVSDEDLEGLYALADVFVYPSLHEGFGLPVLEAMRRGVPVACSNTTSLPEVAGDAALLFDPTDTPTIAAAVRQLLTDQELRAELVHKGHARVSQFSWERCAAEVLEVYERVLAER